MTQPDIATPLPITRVTLYTSGVGYFERDGEVDGEAHVILSFPVGQVNDVLKSLVLLDSGQGALQPVTYAAQDPVAKALAAFSVDLSDSPDRASLLGRMRGTSVTVTTDDTQPVTGAILGVETQTVTHSSDATTEIHTLNLLAEDGLHAVPLNFIRRLQINDSALSEELHQALAVVAQGRDAGKRPVTLHFSGPGARRVQVGYLTEAPAWQTTYRLVLGETPLLQGWALVQNTGQEDWAKVSLSLVSGRPISFIQDVYSPLYVYRPTVRPRIPASPTPQTYAGNLLAEPDTAFATGAATPPPAAPMMARPSAATPAAFLKRRGEMAEDERTVLPGGMSVGEAIGKGPGASGAQLGTALFAYQIDVPVSIPRQQSAMIPFVSAPIAAERVSIYNPQVERDHPLLGTRLHNKTALHLMGGPLTVFDTPEGSAGDAGYVGDALMDDTEPDQSRLMTYAIDLAVDAEAQDTTGTLFTKFSIAEGVLHVRRQATQETVYTFKNHSAQPRNLLIEQPHREPHWALAEPATPAERTATLYRFTLAVPAGETATLTVRQEQPLSETYGLLSTSMDTLLYYIHTGRSGDRVRAAIEDLAVRRAKIVELETKVSNIDVEISGFSQGQDRIRQNMQVLDHKSDLYRRYLGELDGQETKIVSLQNERQTLTVRITQAQSDLGKYVSQLRAE